MISDVYIGLQRDIIKNFNQVAYYPLFLNANNASFLFSI